MHRSFLLFGIFFAALAASAAAGGASRSGAIEPGYWSYRASTLVVAGKNGDQCVAADKIDEFLSGPHDKHYKCTYPTRVLKDGEAQFEGECVSKHGHAYQISLKGHYRSDAFDLSGEVRGPFLGMDLSLPVSIKAHRLSADCPAAANGK